MTCWECSQKNGHARTGGKHMPWHCKPDLCPDKAKHASEMYRGRFTERYGVLTEEGALIIQQVDGVDISRKYTQSRCICGLLLIWTPRRVRAAAEAGT